MEFGSKDHLRWLRTHLPRAASGGSSDPNNLRLGIDRLREAQPDTATTADRQTPLMEARQEWLWYCLDCEGMTDVAPCAHCGADAEMIVACPPGFDPPASSEEAEQLLLAGTLNTIEFYDWDNAR